MVKLSKFFFKKNLFTQFQNLVKNIYLLSFSSGWVSRVSAAPRLSGLQYPSLNPSLGQGGAHIASSIRRQA